MNESRPVRESPPDEEAGRLVPTDLESIDSISKLLLTLNDPSAGAEALARHIVGIRPLKARISERFAVRYPNRKTPQVAQQVALLGNRELEGILLSLLEDLVTLADEVGVRKV